MKQIRNINSGISWLAFLLDMVVIWASYLLSAWLRFNVFNGIDTANMTGKWMAFLFFVYSGLVSLLLFIFKIHSPIDFHKKNKVAKIVFINTLAIIGMVIILFIAHIVNFSRIVLFLFWLLSTFFLVSVFLIEKTLIIRNWDKIAFKKQVVLVGNGEMAQKYMKGIEQQNLPLLYISGYVGHRKEGLGNWLGNYEDLDDVLEKQNPDELVVALEPHEAKYMVWILSVAEKEGIEILLIPFFNEYIPQFPIIEAVGDVSLINLRSTPLNNEWNEFIKRIMDIIGSLLLIVLFFPIMLVTALGVKLSSPGPVFFCQDRVGRGKRTFKMYKFRSMRVNDEEDSGWTKESDPRRTAFGAFIRKYSIDELPQLFNVFKGDMSLVGPRPEIPFYVRQFKETVPLYLVRQQVRPGMTGWAQIHGLRGDTSIEARVRYDIWYIENWSLSLDIKILFRTVFGGFINSEQ